MKAISRNPVAILDVDGTLISGQSQIGLVNYLFRKGLIHASYLIKLNIWFALYKTHLINDIERVFTIGLQYLVGKNKSKMDKLINDYVTEVLQRRVYPKSFDLIRWLKQEGYSILLLSTAIKPIVARVSDILGADDYICTEPHDIDGIYTGKIVGPIIYNNQKVIAVRDYFDSNKLNLKESVAYGDHLSDFQLLKSVGRGYVVNPNKKLRRLALSSGLGILYTNDI